MELRAGYKQTGIGVIPEDWDVVSLQAIADEKAPIRYGVVQIGPDTSDGTPIVPIKYIRQIDTAPLARASKSIEERYAASRVQGGDVLISVKGTIGRVGLVPDGFEGNIAREIARIRAREDMDARFVALQLEADHTQRRICDAVVGTTRLEFSIAAVRDFRISLPSSVPEQRAIATALSDMDAALAGLSRLIAKKRNLKQAAMQQLLTGHIRLPGFTGKWEVKRLWEIGDIRSGGTPSTAQPHFWDGGIPWCTPTDITALNGHKYLSETRRSISSAGLRSSSAEIVPPKSLIMTTRATIGECAINTIPMTTNQGFKNIVPFEDTDIEFLYYLMIMQKDALIALCGGSTFLEIGKNQLSRFEIQIPNIDEQTAIAAVLSDMDTEFTALEAQRDKTRLLKQAMMQELLTGRTRLPIPEDADG